MFASSKSQNTTSIDPDKNALQKLNQLDTPAFEVLSRPLAIDRLDEVANQCRLSGISLKLLKNGSAGRIILIDETEVSSFIAKRQDKFDLLWQISGLVSLCDDQIALSHKSHKNIQSKSYSYKRQLINALSTQLVEKVSEEDFPADLNQALKTELDFLNMPISIGSLNKDEGYFLNHGMAVKIKEVLHSARLKLRLPCSSFNRAMYGISLDRYKENSSTTKAEKLLQITSTLLEHSASICALTGVSQIAFKIGRITFAAGIFTYAVGAFLSKVIEEKITLRKSREKKQWEESNVRIVKGEFKEQQVQLKDLTPGYRKHFASTLRKMTGCMEPDSSLWVVVDRPLHSLISAELVDKYGWQDL